jgi:hypothetical protein
VDPQSLRFFLLIRSTQKIQEVQMCQKVSVQIHGYKHITIGWTIEILYSFQICEISEFEPLLDPFSKLNSKVCFYGPLITHKNEQNTLQKTEFGTKLGRNVQWIHKVYVFFCWSEVHKRYKRSKCVRKCLSKYMGIYQLLFIVSCDDLVCVF